MENKLSAPVGDPKCADPKPGNKTKDIATIEMWLIAQGAPYQMQGKMSPSLIKMIRLYQGVRGKLAKDKITGVISPGDKTWNAGFGKYIRYRDMIAGYEAYEVVENGKTRRIEVDEFIRLQIDVRTRIVNNAKAVQSECDMIHKLIRGLEETMAGQKGFVNAMAALSLSGFGMSPPPSSNAALTAHAAAGAVVAATDRSKVDWKKVKSLVKKANALHVKAVKEWKTYNSKYTKRAEWGEFGATVASEASFAVLEVLATGYLVTTRGMSPKKAQIVAAVGVEGLKVSAGEIGEYAANDKFDPLKSAAKIGGSMMISGVAASLGTKLSGKAYKDVVQKMAVSAKGQFTKRMQSHVFNYVSKFLASGVGQNLIKGAIAEVGNLAKDAGDGKKIDEKRIVEALAGTLIGGLAGSANFKALKKFDANWQTRSVDMAVDKFGPKMERALTLKLVAKHRYRFDTDDLVKLAAKECKDITENAAKKMTELMGKTAYKAVIDKMTGSETSVDAYEKLAVKALEKDSGFMSALEAKVIEEGEKRLKTLEPIK